MMFQDIEQANSYYKQSQLATGSRALKRGYLEKALRLYQKQSHLSRDNLKLASLLRNIGMTNFRLAQIVDEVSAVAEMDLVVYYLKGAVTEFKRALELTPGSFETDWGAGILERIADCFDVGFARIGCAVKDVQIARKQLHSLDKLFEELPDNSNFSGCIARSYLSKAQYTYNCSINCLERNDFRATAQFLESAREAVELAKKHSAKSKSLEFLRELELMEQDIIIYSCCCESVRVRHQADQLFTEYVNDSEELNMEMMWEILDMYKDAVLKAGERDLENEALANSRIGRMFEKIFKMQSKGHLYYRRAFDLAQSLCPRDLSQKPWFIECKNGIERYQMRIVGEEQYKENLAKKPIREKLEKEFAELKKVNNESDAYKLLQFLYSKYPPKVPYTFKEKELNSSTLNSFLRNASIHYHPDKQIQFGLEWKVICEEISKYVNARYSCMKGCDP